MTSKIIECRYATADIQNDTSDYQCNLKYSKDLTMEEGDVLQIKNTFIDTQQQSGGKIVVKSEITASMEYIKYFNKNQVASNLPLLPYDPAFGNEQYDNISQANLDFYGKSMFVATNIDHSSGTPTEITVIQNDNNKNMNGINGSFTVTYFSPGSATTSSQTFPVQNAGSGNPISFNTNVGIIYDANKAISITNTDTDTVSTITGQKAIGGGNQYNIVPIIYKTDITVPPGNYQPTDLATEINRQIQSSITEQGERGKANANPSGVFKNPYANASNFLTTENQGVANSRFLVNIGDDKTDDGSDIIDIALIDEMALLVGASQMELAWDDDLEAFSWNYLHTPFYTEPIPAAAGVAGVPAQPAVGFQPLIDQDENTPVDYFTVLSQSGIVFTSLTSSYPDGSPAELWEGMLGFQLSADQGKGEDPANNLTVQIGKQRKVKTVEAAAVINPANFIDMECFTLDRLPAIGKQITSGFMGLSALIDKNQVNWWQPMANPAAQAPAGGGSAGFLSTTTDTNNILGRQILLSSTTNLYNFGYFLVGLQAGFKSDFYAKESKENIMAIVSRYYEANSFTSGTSDDSVVYVHKGGSTTLSSLGIKILLPDKSLAQNVGNGSAVFVELVKNQQTQ